MGFKFVLLDDFKKFLALFGYSLELLRVEVDCKSGLDLLVLRDFLLLAFVFTLALERVGLLALLASFLVISAADLSNAVVAPN